MILTCDNIQLRGLTVSLFLSWFSQDDCVRLVYRYLTSLQKLLLSFKSRNKLAFRSVRCTLCLSLWCVSVVSVAPHGHHPGDRRLPGEEAGRRERALYSAADAGLPGEDAKLCLSNHNSQK